ncbi:MAG TPA: DUF748 domain-containing protein [Anaeromyxobacter sp.]|nr:DUF748 domain-containing protein [Anaeromyxobacter sp.]
MRRRVPRLAIWIAAVALLLVGARLALDPIAEWRTRKVLSEIEGMRTTFSDVEVGVVGLSYTIRDLRIEKLSAGGAALPFFAVERLHLTLNWRELLRGDVVARVDLDAPRLNVIQKKATGQPASAQQIQETPKVGRKLRDLAPFLVDRAQVKDGQVLVVDASEPERAVVRIHGIELTLENFATRPALARGEPTVLAARGTLQRSGRISAFATADPLAKHVTFAGQGRIEGLRLAELSGLIGAHSDVTAEKGVLDMSLRFRADDGRISGGIRPVVKGASTRPSRPGLLADLESALADAALALFEDDVPGREAVATTIPISGTVDDPKAQAIPTVIGVLRNAFVRGLADSLSGLPPPKAKEREGVLEQARRGLSRGGQPRAQPREEKKK